MKYLNKQQSTFPTLVDEYNVEATGNFEKVNMLNSFFSKCFNPSGSLEENTGSCTESPDESVEDLYCEVEHAEQLLLKVDISKSNSLMGRMASLGECSNVLLLVLHLQLLNCLICQLD